MRDLCMPRNKPNTEILPVVHGVRIHLRQLRERAGLMQEEVAEALDTSHATISRRETGAIPILSRDLAAIAKVYRCDVKEIFSLADELATSTIDLTGGQVRLLQQRIAELREDRNAWRSQAQMLASRRIKPA